MPKQIATGFATIRLHSRSADCWAVVERPSGAIVVDLHQRLLMGLSQIEAEARAAALNAALAQEKELIAV